MAYTDPNKTWTNEPLIAADLNTYLRDQLDALKNPPRDEYVLNEVSDYTTISTTLVDIDATVGKLSQTIITTGGDVLVSFHGVFTGANLFLDVDVDGSPLAGDDGILAIDAAAARQTASFTRIIAGLAAGSHTFKLQWAVFSATATLYAGSGSARDNHAQFWVREV